MTNDTDAQFLEYGCAERYITCCGDGMGLGQVEQLEVGHDEAASWETAAIQRGPAGEVCVKEHLTGILVQPHNGATRAQGWH